MNRFILNIVISVFFILLSGCATTQNLSAASRTSIHTVSIYPTVGMPKDIIYFGAGQNLAAVGGVVGALAAYPSAQEANVQIKNVLLENNIHIDTMVATAFTSQLEKRGSFSVIDNARQADAIFKLQVQQFGLYERAPLSSKVKPIIAISATLVNKNNEVIWKDTEQVNVFNSPAQAYTLKEFLNNPTLLQNGYNLAIHSTVKKLLNNLNQQ